MITKRICFCLFLYLVPCLFTYNLAQNCDSLDSEIDRFIALFQLDSAYVNNIQALECYKTQQNWLKYGECISTIAFFTTEQGKHEMLPEILSSIDTLLRYTGKYDSTLAIPYRDLGIVYRDMHDNDNAIKYIEKGLNIMEINKTNPVEKTAAYATLGGIYQVKLDSEKAIDYYKQSLNIFTDTLTDNQLYTKAITYINLASAYQYAEDYDNAIKNYMLAIYIANSIQLIDIQAVNEQKLLKTVSYSNIASTYNDWNKPDSAIYYLNELQESDFVDTNLAQYYQKNLGIAYHKKKNYKKAVYYLNLSLNTANQSGGNQKNNWKSTIYTAMGELYREQGETQQALEYFQQALIQLIPDFNDELVQNNPNITEVYQARILLNVFQNKAETLYRNYQNTQDQTHLNATLNTYETAIKLIDKIRIEQQHDESVFSLLRTARPIYKGAIEAAYTANKPELVYQLMEKSKAVVLLTALRDAGAKIATGIPDSLVNEEKELNISISYNKRRLNKAQTTDNQEKIKEYNSILFKKREQLQKLLSQLETDYPEYYAIKYNTDVADIDELKNKLKAEKSTAIEYFVGDSTFYACVINDENIALYRFEKGVDFDTNLSDFLSAISNPLTTKNSFIQYTDAAIFLYDNLLKPILPPTENILIIPDGRLNYIPFDALIQHPIKGEYKEPRYDTLSYLVNQYNINYAYSASVLLEKKPQKSISKLKPFAGFAPEFSSDKFTPKLSGDEIAYIRGELGVLLHNQREVKAIQEIMGGSAYLNETATTQHFLDHADEYRIVHFATHAVADDTLQNTGHKIYLQDSTLLPDHIYNSSLNADLVVLSACETGQGELIAGEGVMSLARAFRYIGCPSLAASLWSVDDKSTADIMIDFYKNLHAHQAQNQALANSKRTYLQQLNAYEKAHPFYWAGFVHVGDTSAISTANTSFQWLWLLLLGFLIILFWWKWQT